MNRRLLPLLALLLIVAVIGSQFLFTGSPRETAEKPRTVVASSPENAPAAASQQDPPADIPAPVTGTRTPVFVLPVADKSPQPITAVQQGRSPDHNVSQVPATPGDLAPPSTSRTPLEWQEVTTKSGEKLMGAALDKTWAVPMSPAPVPVSR